MKNTGEEYNVILKNKDRITLYIGKVIFNSYDFPFESNIIEILKFNNIYLNKYRNMYVPPTNINFKLEID